MMEETSMPSHGSKTSKHKAREDVEKKKKLKGNNSSFRKAFRGNLIEESRSPERDERKHDEKLLRELAECLEDCSRQRLRALHMSLRLYGNDESKISNKELAQSLQENGLSVPNRLLRTLTSRFESPQGVDLEGVHKFLADAHGHTGRDSVLAMRAQNDVTDRSDVAQEEIDEDLMWRAESQLIRGRGYIDVAGLRTDFENRDVSKTGRLEFNLVKQVCSDQGMPIYGALLKNLLKRCADRKNQDRVRWAEFMTFLEKAQANAWVTCPSLRELPQETKTKAPVAPSPIDELSARARNALVNKIRKKSSLKRAEKEAKDGEKAATDENQNRTDEAVAQGVTEGKLDTETNTTLKVPGAPNGETDEKMKTEDKNGCAEQLSVPVVINTGREGHTQTDTRTKTQQVDTTAEQDLQIETTKTAHDGDSTCGESSKDNDNKDTPKDTHVTITIDQPSRDDSPERRLAESRIGSTNGDADRHGAGANVEETSGTGEDVDKETNKDETERTKTEDMDYEASAETDTVEIEAEKTVEYEIEVRGKTFCFAVDQNFLDRRNAGPPAERLRLEWVYGYRGNDCRKNMHVLGSGELVYFISYMAILLDRRTDRQRHYREHTDDIKCIDVHSDKVIVASGQYASRRNNMIQAHVRVWRSDTLQTLRILGMGHFDKCVVCLAFRPDKDSLVAVDNSLEKRLTVWDSVTGELQGQQLLQSDLICDVGFNPRYSDTIVTIGKEHLSWWKLSPESNTLQALDKPEYNGFLRAKFVICMAFTERGDLITGDSNGTIYVFGNGGNKVTNYVKHAHDGPVFTVLVYRGQLLSGGRDGLIHCWQLNKNMDSTGFVQLGKAEGGIRMLRVSDQKLVVGTTMNSILAVNLTEGESALQGAQLDVTPITQCHYDELRGLTTLRNSSSDVITAGIDGIVCGFNTGSHSSVFKFQIKGNQYLCVDVDETGTFMALGTKDGRVHLLRSTSGTWTEVVIRKLCKDRINCVRLSPDCRNVAVGSHDSNIYILSRAPDDDRAEAWEYVGKLKDHTGPVHSMDWSVNKIEEGYLLRSCTSNHELKYWLPANVQTYEKLMTLAPREWASHTALVDPNTVGILATRNSSDAEIMCVAINKDQSLAAMGDNSGSVHLYRAPCSVDCVSGHSYKSHATVHCVRFTPCGKRIVTVGGRDSCMMQWEIV